MRETGMMNDIRVMVVEDDADWQDLLVKEVRRACRECPIRVAAPDGSAKAYPPWDGADGNGKTIWVYTAGNYAQSEVLLSDRTAWNLIITDIVLKMENKDTGFKFGMNVARIAKEKGIACLAVSGSLAVDRRDVRYLMRECGVVDFFDKGDFIELVDQFRAHVRRILFSDASGEDYDVVIGFGEDSFVLRARGAEVYIPPKHTVLFACFARKVYKTAAGEQVELSELNGAVGGGDAAGAASDRLRRAISRLNEHLRTKLGPAPDGEAWVHSGRGSGYALNTNRVRWSLEPTDRLKALGRSSQSVYAVLIDPAKFQANTPDDDD